jgi:hypothetical protein
MPSALYIGGMPNVCPSSGTIGTISLPMFASRQSWPISVTQASVVDCGLVDALYSPSNPLRAGGGDGLNSVLRNGWYPPSALRRSRRYFISAPSSGSR